MLARGELPVNWVSCPIGYRNSAHVAGAFRSIESVSPDWEIKLEPQDQSRFGPIDRLIRIAMIWGPSRHPLPRWASPPSHRGTWMPDRPGLCPIADHRYGDRVASGQNKGQQELDDQGIDDANNRLCVCRLPGQAVSLFAGDLDAARERLSRGSEPNCPCGIECHAQSSAPGLGGCHRWCRCLIPFDPRSK